MSDEKRSQPPYANNRRQLHKFGGSSLREALGYRRAITILEKYGHPGDLIVVSASGKTTNQLIAWFVAQKAKEVRTANKLSGLLKAVHTELINTLLPSEYADPLIEQLEKDFNHLTQLILSKSDHVAHTPSQENLLAYNECVGQGEIWSSRLMNAALSALSSHPSCWLDARAFLYADDSVQPTLLPDPTNRILQQHLEQYADHYLVIPGFIAKNKAGETILLGRNGSDYSATYIAALADIQDVTLWSDTAGAYSADPHQVEDAMLRNTLSIPEAAELARLGSSLLHTRTLDPLTTGNISLHLRSSFNPEAGKTDIKPVVEPAADSTILISRSDISLIEMSASLEKSPCMDQKQLANTLKQLNIVPLTIQFDTNRATFELSYPTEVAPASFTLLKEKLRPKCLRVKSQLFLLSLVGRLLKTSPGLLARFHKLLQTVRTLHICTTDDQLSTTAILQSEITPSLLQAAHGALFKQLHCTQHEALTPIVNDAVVN